MKEGITSTKAASRICYETPWLATLRPRLRRDPWSLVRLPWSCAPFLMGLGLNQIIAYKVGFFQSIGKVRRKTCILRSFPQRWSREIVNGCA